MRKWIKGLKGGSEERSRKYQTKKAVSLKRY